MTNETPESEIDLGAKLEQARAQNRRRCKPSRTVGEVFSEHRARIEDIVDVEHPLPAGPAYAEGLGQAEVELAEPLFELRVRLEQGNVDAGGARSGRRWAARQVAPERGRNLRIGGDEVREDRNPWQVLVRRARLKTPPWQRVVAFTLD